MFFKDLIVFYFYSKVNK